MIWSQTFDLAYDVISLTSVRFIFVSTLTPFLYPLKTQKVGVQQRSCNFSHRENDAVQIQPILTNRVLFFDFSSCLRSSWAKILSFSFFKFQIGFVKKGVVKTKLALRKFQFTLQFLSKMFIKNICY